MKRVSLEIIFCYADCSQCCIVFLCIFQIYLIIFKFFWILSILPPYKSVFLLHWTHLRKWSWNWPDSFCLLLWSIVIIISKEIKSLKECFVLFLICSEYVYWFLNFVCRFMVWTTVIVLFFIPKWPFREHFDLELLWGSFWESELITHRTHVIWILSRLFEILLSSNCFLGHNDLFAFDTDALIFKPLTANIRLIINEFTIWGNIVAGERTACCT